MKKKSAHQESKGLKTFFVYAGIVLLFITISLAIKMVFVIKSSKFDERHQFVFTISQSEKIKKIILFDPTHAEMATVEIQGEAIDVPSASKLLGFIPDATVNTDTNINLESDTSSLLRTLGFKYGSIKTDLTILDVIRLAIASHTTVNEQAEEIVVKENEYNINNVEKNLFVDEEISSEDISIQVINASGVSGMGKRLERILSNLGCNVISVTTAPKQEKLSKIQYYGETSYTLQKMERLLKFPLVALESKQIADIVIIVGEDSKNPINY